MGPCVCTTGIAYQLVPDDPLIDTAQCTRDATLMQTLGANAIRVYHVDPDGSHDGCMKAFADRGIYMFIDLDTFTTQIEQVSRGFLGNFFRPKGMLAKNGWEGTCLS